MTDKLLPCPFCGGKADSRPQYGVVECMDCGIEKEEDDLHSAEYYWNTRTTTVEEPPDVFQRTMKLCPICGNKRCPHATDVKYKCTNSNRPGQSVST